MKQPEDNKTRDIFAVSEQAEKLVNAALAEAKNYELECAEGFCQETLLKYKKDADKAKQALLDYILSLERSI